MVKTWARCMSSFLTVCVCHVLNCRRIPQASEKGHTGSYIVCPAAIVGPSREPAPPTCSSSNSWHSLLSRSRGPPIGENVLHTVGISYPHMMRLPFLLPNVSPWVCLDDLVHLYKCIFAHVLGQVHHCQHTPLLEAHYDHNRCRPHPHRSWWLKFERQHGMGAQQEDVIVRCQGRNQVMVRRGSQSRRKLLSWSLLLCIEHAVLWYL